MTESQPAPGIAARIQRIENGILPDIPIWNQESDFHTTIADRMAFYRTPGLSLAVINHGDLEWAKGYGRVEAGESSPPVTPDTRFQVCSISKHVTMLAALRLVQENVLDFEEDVNRYLTSWKIPANGSWQPRISLRQVLGHTAGLTQNWYRGFRRAGPGEAPEVADATPTLRQVLEGQPPANTPPIRVKIVPGSQFRYSGSHYTVLQQVLMDVTGKPFPDLMQELVFDPLDMRHSSFDQQYPETVPDSVAVGHCIGGEPVLGQWRILPEMAAAGLWTTAVDLAQVACELYRTHAGRPTRLLQKEVVDQALTPQLADDFGLGVQLEGKPQRFGHGGDNIGYKCLSTTYVEQGMGAIALTNGDDGRWVIEEVVRAVAQEYAWPGFLPNHRLSPAAGAESYAAYEGEYRIAAPSERIVRVVITGSSEAGASPPVELWVADQPPIVLRPTLADSTATFVADHLNVEVRFTKNAAGEVTGLTLMQEQQETPARRVG